MFEVAYRLFEMAALVLCVHNLSGKKVKADIHNTGFIALQLIFMQIIQDGVVSKQMYFVIYLNYFIYIYIKFKDSIKKTTLKFMLSVIMIVSLQMLIYIPASFLNYIIPKEEFIILVINATMFLVLFLTRNSSKYKKIVDLCSKKDWVLRAIFCLWVAIMIYCIFSLKISKVINIDIFILVILFITMFSVFLFRWQKSMYEIEQKEREFKITNLYNGVFEELIGTIRRRQHDFHNQIDAIYGMHLTAKSYDELVKMQDEYCKNLVYENRYYKVLSCTNNSTLSGFLYTKFTNAEKRGIEVECTVSFMENTSISVYDLVEIIGILMDNAIEYLEENKLPKKIIFSLNDFEGLNFSVKNPIQNISNNDVAQFFKEGYTTKVTGSGIGLSKIKEYQKKYNYDICVEITQFENNEWLELRIVENM